MCGRAVDCGRVLCVPVCLCVCVSVCMGEWGKGKGHGKAKRETRGGEGGVQYSVYKLALSEELERCVESVHTYSMCVCAHVCLVV